MSDTTATFDPPVGTASSPAASRARRAWLSPAAWRSLGAAGVALVVHGAVLWGAGMLPTRDAADAPRLQPEHTASVETIALEDFEVTPPADVAVTAAPQPEPVSPAMAARIATIARVQEAIAATAAAPRVAAAPAAEAAPLDLSHVIAARGSAMVAAVGQAGGGALAGAAHAAAGSGGAGAAGTAGGGEPAPRGSLAQAARTSGGAWRCDWPSEAREADIYELYVTVRVVVDADGSVVSAAAQGNPGFGFAQAVEACARRQTYTPALDDGGRPVRATTPAIRVRFWR